jgi:molecular chaperone IbpA
MYTTLAKYNTGNIEKFLTDLEKNFIGADEWFHRFGTVHESSSNYPPYNLIKESSTEFTLEIALAGYKQEDIEVSSEWNKLFVECKKAPTEYEYMHNGIARRAFTRTWTLSDDVVVGDVSFVDGLLTIKLNRVIPDHQKRKTYEIVSGVHGHLEGNEG